MTIQETTVTRLGWIKNTPISLLYVTGDMPLVLTNVITGEFFLTGLFVHAENNGTVTIEELDGSAAMVKNLVIKKESPLRFSASIGDLNSHKFYSGVRLISNKANTHFQLRGFRRAVSQTPDYNPIG